MSVASYKTANREHIERLFVDVPMAEYSGLYGVKELSWMYDPERAARIRRVVQLIVNEAQDHVEEPPYYPVYYLSVVRPVEGDPMVYTARWGTKRDNPFEVQSQMMGTLWLMRDNEPEDMKDAAEVFKAYDSRPYRGYDRLMSPSHVKNLVPPIFSAAGFVALVQSAQQEF